MLGGIKYLRRVRVETDALKRNKDLASTRTLSPSFGKSGRRFKSCYSNHHLVKSAALSGTTSGTDIFSRSRVCWPFSNWDRAPDYESGGQEFESLRARQCNQ
jgi:hypothetical protein